MNRAKGTRIIGGRRIVDVETDGETRAVYFRLGRWRFYRDDRICPPNVAAVARRAIAAERGQDVTGPAMEQARIDAEPEPIEPDPPSGRNEQDHLFTAAPMPRGQISMGEMG